MIVLAAIGLLIMQTPGEVVSWAFDAEADAAAWVANGHLANVAAKDGILSADAVDWDPFFTCRDVEFTTNPWQFIVLRMRSDQPGQGEVFWSGELTGQYGGLSPQKSTPFRLRGDGSWEEVAVFPLWQTEGTIRQLRLDVYDGAHFDVDSIQILEWGADKPPATEVYSWDLDGRTDAWRVHPAADELFAPRLRLPVEGKGWVTVQLRSDKDATASILWSVENLRGLQSQDFALRGDAASRIYDVELAGNPDWRDPVVAFGIRLPKDGKVTVDSIRIAEEPSGPPEVEVSYFGFENGVNRAGRPCRLLAQLANRGGSQAKNLRVHLALPSGVRLVDGPLDRDVGTLDYDDLTELTWGIVADAPGSHAATLTVEGEGALGPSEAALQFLPPLNLEEASYVPEPRPIEATLDVCMYYFPGWNSDAKWDCIRRVAPIRKPLLGYYDEGNPECVDWQIKWAVENGISCFLVDWYWVDGRKQLEHWFEAYRKARYRDQLKVAIMWANHNPPNTHSREDWRNVTREWIDKYFPLETYYRIDGKPVVFLWSPSNIRNDLGGSEAVAAAFQESQAMARAAGYEGITFLAMFGHESTSGVKALLDEGYYGATNYHEWGKAQQMAQDPKRATFEDIVTTVAEVWREKVARCGDLVYYPVVDTGWDSRPWHGDKSLVISGRTPERFERLLRHAAVYCGEAGRDMVVLGPANEWGEGSYIEPNTEFGFEMMERVRAVFGKGDPASWPVNVGPADLGLGPYDFPARPQVNAWTFDADPEGWSAMMGIADFVCRDGALRFKTASNDPALVVNTQGLRAKAFTKAVLRMQIIGPVREDAGQLFFSVGGRATSEAASYRFPLATDGALHAYEIDLTTNPRWRSRIASVRFDPCSAKDVEVVLDEFRFE